MTACVLDSPVADLIIGNVIGVKDCTEEEVVYWDRKYSVSSNEVVTTREPKLESIAEVEEALEVDTGTQDKDSTAEQVRMDPKYSASDSQRQDTTLNKCSQGCRRVEHRQSKKGRWCFERKNNVLTRRFSDSRTARGQGAVPLAHRDRYTRTAQDSACAGHIGHKAYAAESKDARYIGQD